MKGSPRANTAAWTTAVLALLPVSCAGEREPPPPPSPIAFNHRVHVEEEGLECLECHLNAETGVHAGIPPSRLCMLCHDEPLGEHPDEPKIREFAAAGEEIPWRSRVRTRGHEEFSHLSHVRLLGMECALCHGDVASGEHPGGEPAVSAAALEGCRDCHQKAAVRTDCGDCHR